MDIHFTTSMQNRKMLYRLLKHTPKEVLFAIPDGFRNNIWWNIAHVVAVQQSLFYYLSGTPLTVEKALVKKYAKGTFPEGEPSAEEMETISKALFSSVEQAWEDYRAGKFVNYNPYETSAKVTLSNIEDAIAFNSFHEGLHLGSILGLLKAQKIPIPV